MSYHKDEEVNNAFIRLMDALCSWERNTFRSSTLIFVPDNIDEYEKVIIAQDGKPLVRSDDPFMLLAILNGLKMKVQSSEKKEESV